MVVEKSERPDIVSCKFATDCHDDPFQNAQVTPFNKLPNVLVLTSTRLNVSEYPT